eukprot:Nk52_evm72s164 gene=Nk52_evmTU72s164
MEKANAVSSDAHSEGNEVGATHSHTSGDGSPGAGGEADVGQQGSDDQFEAEFQATFDAFNPEQLEQLNDACDMTPEEVQRLKGECEAHLKTKSDAHDVDINCERSTVEKCCEICHENDSFEGSV